jgi:3D (Asp-Asp-Asp) domain-containing protein
MLRPKNSKVWTFLILAGVITIFLISLLLRSNAKAEEFLVVVEDKNLSEISFSQDSIILPVNSPPLINENDVRKRIKVMVTAYSSSVWETQGNPFITASGTRVKDGIAANNLLKFGTKIRLPEIFGDKVFVVEDRMNSKKGYYHVDVWFPSREEALKFGAKLTEMEVLNY